MSFEKCDACTTPVEGVVGFDYFFTWFRPDGTYTTAGVLYCKPCWCKKNGIVDEV